MIAAVAFGGRADAAVVFLEDFDGTSTWANNAAASLFVDPGSSDQGLFIQPGVTLGPDNVLYGSDLANEPGEPQLNPVTLNFDPVSVAGLNDVSVTFDYDLDGFDASDSISYDVVVDGASASTGTFGGDDAGTLNYSVAPGAMSVALTLVLDQNGAADSFELDNFAVNAAVAIPEPASVVMFAAGLIAVGLRRRRR